MARWIAAGAPEVDVEPDVATTSPTRWSPTRTATSGPSGRRSRSAVPTSRQRSASATRSTPSSSQKLEAKGLTLSPRGRPPHPVAARVVRPDRPAADAGGGRRPSSRTRPPDAYEKLVDRLLASPRYGERWGRHWLDLAGYADSEGKREQDLPRPHAWRYRDYVIRAFNADKPYDRFLLEQLAGDELADYETPRRSRRRSTTTWSPPASSAWRPTPPGRTSPASSRTGWR